MWLAVVDGSGPSSGSRHILGHSNPKLQCSNPIVMRNAGRADGDCPVRSASPRSNTFHPHALLVGAFHFVPNETLNCGAGYESTHGVTGLGHCRDGMHDPATIVPHGGLLVVVLGAD